MVDHDPTDGGGTGPLLYGSELGAGAQIGDWVIDELRGRGGFATVYRARHYLSAQLVAVKVLHDALVGDPAIRKRFLREAEAIRRLDHPGVVRLLEVGEFGAGRPFLVIEWLAGRTLDERLRAGGPLALDEALRLVDDLAAALTAAHALGIVHRDVKASNVMLLGDAADPHLVLLDFGIAKLLDDQIAVRERLTSTGMRIGSPTSMAPEQLLGGTVDARTDVYALGVLLFQVLTGRPPFLGGALEIEELHLRGPVPSASALAPVPAAIDHVLRCAMAKQPADRPPTVLALAAELRAAAAGLAHPAAARPPAAAAAATALVLRAHTMLADDDAGDDAFDDLDAITAAIEAACAAAGLAPTLDAPGALTVTRPLPDDPAAALAARRALVELARGLADRLTTRRGAHPGVRVHLSLDVSAPACADAETRVAFDTPAQPRRAVTLVVADAVLDGLDVTAGS